MSSIRTAAALGIVVTALGLSGAAPAQMRLPGSAPPETPETPAQAEAAAPAESLAAQRAELATNLEALRAQVAAGTASAAAIERLALLERLDRTLAAQQQSVARLEGLGGAGTATEQGSLIGADPPYPFGLYEATGRALDAHRKQLELLEKRNRTQTEELERLTTRLDAAERERRRAKEQLESQTDPLEKAALAETLRRREVESRLAVAELAAARASNELDQQRIQDEQRQVALLEATLRHVRDRVVVSRYDLDEPLHNISLEEERTRAEIAKARTRLETAERRLADVQKRSDPLPSVPAELRAEVDARWLQRQLAQARINVAESRLDQLTLERQTWERRFGALTTASRADLLLWAEEIDTDLDGLRRQEQLHASHREELAQRAASLTEAIGAAPEAEAVWLREQLQAVTSMSELYERAIVEVQSTRALLKYALRDFQPVTGRRSLLPRVRAAASRAADVWDREVFVVDDRSITVGKLLLASLLTVLAFSVSRLIATLLGRLIFRRLLTPGAALASQSLTFYALLVTFLLLALRTVNIPLTAFALLGGALAIGLGFGSQNVIGNFISGLILLVERPVRVGDVVEVDGVAGTIERVGPRSTQIRTFDNLQLVLPNSRLIEQKLVNWTLSDDTVRRQIVVGVAYDSDPGEVTRLMRQALQEHPRVLKTPEPQVFFQDFGDNALVFRAYLWAHMEGNVSLFAVESQLRHRIFALFRDAGVTIAYPQRDMHLDTLEPLEVRVLPAPDGD